MKKILFVMPNLKNGGMATAFLGLLNEIKDDKNLTVDVLLLNDEFKDKLPSNVNLLPTNKFLKLPVASQQQVSNDSKIFGIFRLFLGFYAKTFGDTLVYKLLMISYKKLKDYDYAISFAQSASNHSLYGGCNEFVLNKVDAKCKIAFIHCDYVNAELNTKHNSKIYSKFDKIAAVSNGVKNVFVNEEPKIKDKVYTVHNCHNFEKIKRLSETDAKIYDKNYTNLLTIARLSAEKGHIRLLKVLIRLKNEGYKFVWHIVGGADKATEDDFMNLVKENNMESFIEFYGNTDNPYRFFLNADVMIQASFHEAAPMVFSEAECLKLPVITTDTLSAKEFISDKGYGIVCKNSSDGLYSAIKKIMDDKMLLKNIKIHMENSPYPTNEKALNEFYKLLEN